MKKTIRWMSLMCVLSAALSAAVVASHADADATKEIVLTPAAEVKYVPLDPADKQGKGPQISVVFGDMKKKEPLGFYFKVPPGFRPGPHTHTSDYHAVV